MLSKIEIEEFWIKSSECTCMTPWGSAIYDKLEIHTVEPIIQCDFMHVVAVHCEDENLLKYAEWSIEKHLNELNETNTEIYINENKFKYKKFFIPDKEGIYKIKLILNTFVKDCSHMFYGCKNIINIDLSFFISKNVKNMSYMFYDCCQLEQINLSTFDTQNATNMESMFDNCISMENLNLSSFNTKNVTNMMYMFAGCKKLKSIDLSSFNTKNVENIDLIFYDCLNLNQIKINSEFCDKIIDIIKSSNIEIIKT